MPTNSEVLLYYFCAAYDYAGKADLSKGYSNPKRKLGGTTHFFLRDNEALIILKTVKYKAVYDVFSKLKLYNL